MIQLARRHYDQAALVLAVLATLLISNNTERPLAYALPVLLPAALLALRWFIDETGLSEAPVLVTVVALQAFFWARHPFAGEAMSMYQPTNVGTALVMALAYGAARWAIARGNAIPSPASTEPRPSKSPGDRG